MQNFFMTIGCSTATPSIFGYNWLFKVILRTNFAKNEKNNKSLPNLIDRLEIHRLKILLPDRRDSSVWDTSQTTGSIRSQHFNGKGISDAHQKKIDSEFGAGACFLPVRDSAGIFK
jgi:hypothetical protein